ncbi:MAG: helix-turn-helix transcriptional regulator [bacterium]
MAKSEKTSNAVEILHGRYIKGDVKREAALDVERVNVEVAQLIYDLRNEAGLTQTELAELIGTTQSVISRLEDADYEGHSLSMLSRIARALKQKLTVVMTAKDPETGSLRESFHLCMRMLRQYHGLTIDELARRADIEREEIIAIERNGAYRPTPLTLHKLGNFYDIPHARLAVLAGAVRDVPENVRQEASRFAAHAESFAVLSPEEKELLDGFVKFLRAEK